MAMMFQIYLRDKLVDQTPSAKRTILDIRNILSNIVPSSTELQTINSTRQGFIVTYSNDSQVNFIFNPAIIEQLRANNLTADLANGTQLLRKVVISGLTNDIYSKENTDILQEFEQNNPAKILLISKFETPQSKEKYLFVTLASKGDRDLIIGNGSINLFQSNFPVHQTRPKKQNTNFGPHQAPRSSFTPSAQRLGQALSSASNWGGYRHTKPNHHSRNQHSHYSSAFETSDFEN